MQVEIDTAIAVSKAIRVVFLQYRGDIIVISPLFQVKT